LATGGPHADGAAPLEMEGVPPAAHHPRRAVAADHWRADRAAADRRDTGHPVPLPRRQDPQPLAPARTRLTQEPWRARCVERRTAGSASGLEKRASGNAGTALQADS